MWEQTVFNEITQLWPFVESIPTACSTPSSEQGTNNVCRKGNGHSLSCIADLQRCNCTSVLLFM